MNEIWHCRDCEYYGQPVAVRVLDLYDVIEIMKCPVCDNMMNLENSDDDSY